MNKKKPIKFRTKLTIGIILAGLTAGCSLPKPKFDMKTYADNFWKKSSSVADKLTFWNNQEPSSYSPAIYGFGGLAVFGDGQTDNVLANICPTLEVSDCHYHKLGKWPKIMHRIKYQYKTGHPIIFIGHSAGCGEAVNVANELKKIGMPIGMIFLDASYLNSGLYKPNCKIPSNVYRIENYISKGPYKGKELEDSDFEGNNLMKAKSFNFRLNTSHVGMTKKFQDEYIDSVQRILSDYHTRIRR